MQLMYIAFTSSLVLISFHVNEEGTKNIFHVHCTSLLIKKELKDMR